MASPASLCRSLSNGVGRIVGRKKEVKKDDHSGIPRSVELSLERFLGMQEQKRRVWSKGKPFEGGIPDTMNEHDMVQLVFYSRVSFPNSWISYGYDFSSSRCDFSKEGLSTEEEMIAYISHLEGSESITSVKFPHDRRLTPALAMALCKYMPNIQEVILAHAQNLNPIALGELVGLKKLMFVDLSSSWRVTAASISHLVMNREIIGLNLSGCPTIETEGFNRLFSLKKLQWLQISWCSGISDLGFYTLKYLQELKHLEMQGVMIHQESCLSASLPQKVTHLDLGYIRNITPEAVDTLAERCQNLQFLSLRGCFYTSPKALSRIEKFKQLKKLDLGFMSEVDNSVIESISHLSLTALNLDGCTSMTKSGFKFLQKLPLKYLSLSQLESRFNWDWISLLPETVEELNLEACTGVDYESSLKTLSQFKSLRNLRFEGANRITLKVAELWKRRLSLEYLRLRRCAISPDVVQALKVKNLEVIWE